MQKRTDEKIIAFGTERLKRGFTKMQKGGVIMDVTNPEQAIIAEDAGAIAVMALQAVPADIRAAGGVARMADPAMIKAIMNAVTIPVMAKCMIGHFAEAQVLEALGVDMIDESEVLTPADEEFHVGKHKFKIPFVCGAYDLGQALRRIDEGAAMIRTKGEAGTGNVVEAVRHIRLTKRQISELAELEHDGIEAKAQEYRVPIELVEETAKLQRLPVIWFCAGGIATSCDAAMVMQLGVDGVFVGSGIFKSSDPPKMARAIVEATRHYDDPQALLEASKDLPQPMRGIDIKTLKESEKLQARGV